MILPDEYLDLSPNHGNRIAVSRGQNESFDPPYAMSSRKEPTPIPTTSVTHLPTVPTDRRICFMTRASSSIKPSMNSAFLEKMIVPEELGYFKQLDSALYDEHHLAVSEPGCSDGVASLADQAITSIPSRVVSRTYSPRYEENHISSESRTKPYLNKFGASES